MVREEAISLFLGYVSITSWLGAQFPQIIVNWRRHSVDGLALPFLANWLLGDTTNLIGCLLTDQLPFQTYLATYFVFVDICLVTQYLYYDAPRRRQSKSLATLTSPTAHQSHVSLTGSTDGRPFPRTHISRPRSRSYSIEPLHTPVENMTLTTSELDGRYQDTLASELDVHGSHGRRRARGGQRASSLEGLPESIVADPRESNWGGRRFVSLDREGEEVDEESDSVPSPMLDSFHSEGGGRGRGRGKRVSWTQEGSTLEDQARPLSQDPLPMDAELMTTTIPTMRGRQLTRDTIYNLSVGSEAPPIPADSVSRPRRASAASAVSAAASRRSASIVFLGIFALFGLSSRAGFRRNIRSVGDVLSISSNNGMLIPEPSDAIYPLHVVPSTPISFESVVPLQEAEVNSFTDGDMQRLIGRVSAWTCTTLYLTSRLPQIWKNFARKSVEGLSMYLFIFAFLGNFFYVLSILTNPKMDLAPPLARQFIRDSVPYLLGSGGTLLFDITIVLQSLVYAPSRRRLRVRDKRKPFLGGDEEERGLLVGEHRDENAR